MFNLYPRHRLQESSVDDVHENVEAECYNPFYAIAVVCVSIFLFCVLAAFFNVWKALASAALAGLLLGVAGCFAPKGWFRRPSGRAPSTTELVVVTVDVTPGAARPGYPCPQVNAPPAFAFQCALDASCAVVCSVCLEDVRSGEMVRQVPACRHVFHMGCIDMWLHSHRTCPMCRCVVSPPSQVVAPKAAAAEEAQAREPEYSSEDELPPV